MDTNGHFLYDIIQTVEVHKILLKNYMEKAPKLIQVIKRRFFNALKRGVEMSIGNIIRAKQPDIYKVLIKIANEDKPNKPNKPNKLNKPIKNSDENISLDDFEKMMRHDSFKKVHGAIRQIRHG